MRPWNALLTAAALAAFFVSTPANAQSARCARSGAVGAGACVHTDGGTVKSVQSMLGTLSPLDYGAKCDGSTDDTTALTNWAAAIVSGTHAVLPNSSCLFKSPIAFPNVNYWSLEGAGEQSQLLYAGTTTTGNIVTIGNIDPATPNGCANKGFTLKNLRVMSNTVMTAGVGVAFGHLCEAEIENFRAGADLDGSNSNWYNAVQFYGGNSLHMRGYSFRASHIAEIAAGDASHQLTDLYQIHGKISHSGTGLNLAGGVGGFNIEDTDILLNGGNVVVDQSVSGTHNLQLFFGKVAIDVTSGGTGIGFDLNDAGGGISATLEFNGTSLASATNECLIVESGVTYLVTFNGGNVYNCGADGLKNNSTTSTVNLTGTVIAYNGNGTGTGYGINNTVSNNAVRANGVLPISNHTGDFNGVTNYSYINHWHTASNIDINVNGGSGVVTVPILDIDTTAGGNADLRLHAASAGADQKFWSISDSTAGNLTIRAVNDAYSASNDWLTFTRASGYTVGTITSAAPLTITGSSVPSFSNGAAAVYATTTGGGIFSGQGSTNDVQLRNKNDQAALVIQTGSTDVVFTSAIKGITTATTSGAISTTGGSAPSLSNGVSGLYSSATGGAILTGQGSTNDVQLRNKNDQAALAVPTGTTDVVFSGAIRGATTVTTSGAISTTGGSAPALSNGVGGMYTTSANGLIFTGQGSTYDLLFANNAGNSILKVPTGTRNSLMPGQVAVGANGSLTAGGLTWTFEAESDQNGTTLAGVVNNNTGASAESRFEFITGTTNSNAYWNLLDASGSPTFGLVLGSALSSWYAPSLKDSGYVAATGTSAPTLANGTAGVYASATNGGLFTGQGSSNDLQLVNKSGSAALSIPTGTTDVSFAGSVTAGTWHGTAVGTAYGGTGATTAQAATQNLGTWYAVAKSAATGMSHTGDTNETALATISIPANSMGSNGVLRITTTWTETNNGNAKTGYIRLGGSGLSGTQYLATAGSSIATQNTQTLIFNQNSTSAQVGAFAIGNSSGFGTATGALPTSAYDMTASQQLVISGKLGVNTDTITLSSYLVEVLN